MDIDKIKVICTHSLNSWKFNDPIIRPLIDPDTSYGLNNKVFSAVYFINTINWAVQKWVTYEHTNGYLKVNNV